MFVLVISCIEGYKQLTEYYKAKTKRKTAVHQCFVCFYGLRSGICFQKFVCLNSVAKFLKKIILRKFSILDLSKYFKKFLKKKKNPTIRISSFDFTCYFGHWLPWQMPLWCHLIAGQLQTNKRNRK